VNVEAVGKFPDMIESITWRRRWLEGSSSATSSNYDVGNIRQIGWSKYEQVNNRQDDKTALPVIGFFGIQRAVGAGRVTQKSRRQVGKRIFKDGYQDWESMVAVKFHYPEWLGTYDALLAHKKEYEGTKDAFYSCIKTANPFISQIEFIQGSLWIKVKVEKHESDFLPIYLHSDGIHYFTEMVAEIAYRCVVLNGYKKENTIKESTGIIMIDELDLHLHPTWQRHVVSDLKRAFPNIQFVVTTHSPFIVQSLKSDELVILDEEINKQGDPFKKSLEEVAANEMGVEDIPRSQEFMEMQKVAEEYYKLVSEGRSSQNDQRVRQLRERLNKLEEKFSEDAAFVAALKIERKANDL
jgi:predicted ATP-binding protein involved in virulence